MQLYDQTTDSLSLLAHEIRTHVGEPEYVKYASHAEIAGEGLPRHLYADSAKRRFPIHTKAAVWTSAAYFLKQADQLEPVVRDHIWTSLLKAARLFGVHQDVLELLAQNEKMASVPDTSELADSQFGLILDGPEGKERLYPLRNREEVKVACDWFLKYRYRMPFPHRHKFAQALLRKADQFGVFLDEEKKAAIEKSAGLGTAPASQLAGRLLQRAGLVGKWNYRLGKTLEKLAEQVLQSGVAAGEEGYPFRVKLAEQLDQIDRMLDLQVKYASGLPSPEEVCFSMTASQLKEAVEDLVALPDGKAYSLADLAKITTEDLRKWFGDAVAEELSTDGKVSLERLAGFIRTLPPAEAELFEQMAEEAGVKPVLQDQSIEGIRPEDIVATLACEPSAPTTTEG